MNGADCGERMGLECCRSGGERSRKEDCKLGRLQRKEGLECGSWMEKERDRMWLLDGEKRGQNVVAGWRKEGTECGSRMEKGGDRMW